MIYYIHKKQESKKQITGKAVKRMKTIYEVECQRNNVTPKEFFGLNLIVGKNLHHYKEQNIIRMNILTGKNRKGKQSK